MNNCIGIDISKKTFDFHCLTDDSDHHVNYTAENIQKTVEKFTSMEPELIVMEATGGYEIPLAEALYAAGLPIAIINPRRIRDFAKAVGQTAKTDKIDARIIARYGATLEPPPTEFLDEATRNIRTLVARKRQLMDMRVAEKNRMEHARNDFTESSILAAIDFFDNQLAEADKQILRMIAASPELKQKADIMKSVIGIGEKTAAGLVTEFPEIGTVNGKEAASLTGTAPMNRDSGQFRGKRMTGGGRREIRKLLYMPTLAAIRHNPVIRSYYYRLLARGKKKMVAVIACMRKLIVILNSMVAKNQKWDPNHA